MNLNYVAGLFDGEGYIYIFKKVRRNHVGFYVSVGVNMTHRPTIEALHTQFGGHFNINRVDLKNPKHRCCFMWGASNQLAADFLNQVRPLLVIKRAEADIAISLQDHISNTPYKPGKINQRKDRDEILAYREELYLKCKALKHIQFSPLTAQ